MRDKIVKVLIYLALIMVNINSIESVGEATIEDRIYTRPTSVEPYKYIAHVSSKAGICTGTILSPDWILSAAHCFYYNSRVIGDKDAKILVGVVNYEFQNMISSQDRMSKLIKIHPRFWYGKVGKFDIALVQVQHPFVFSKTVGSIELATDEWPQDENATNCMTLGFGGYRSTAPLTQDLKVWNLSASHGESSCEPCARRYQAKRLICVKEEFYATICHGDDGGPLICGNVVRGISHMVWNRYTCDEPTYPKKKCFDNPDKGLSTFMFLCPFYDWMHEVFPQLPEMPPSCDANYISYCVNLLIYAIIVYLVVCWCFVF